MAKMAVLVDGTRYGLTSQVNNNDNKTLIFVKLTDSALRAIEEYLNNRGNTSRKPTIQFHGNHGVLKFPSSHHSSEEHSFDFTFCPSSDSESLQGSFECIQKCGSRSLESLGCMQYKMHIHAKDDVYQATKSRMAAAEEESKKNCTKVIKPAAPCIGRKVKVKKTFTHSLKPPPSSPPYLSSKPSNPLLPKPIANGHVNGIISSHHHNNQPKPHHKTHGNSEIMKRSYRERIIHLLALRPYKKPELLARLMKDGIKEKDKKSLQSILSQVANMKDNTYQLAKHVWSEVQENWPFYSEADRQLLKRRMPQNLSPSLVDEELSPGSNSMNNSPGSQTQKRQNNDHNSSAIPTKKQRISHYTKQQEPVNNGKLDFVSNANRNENHQVNGHHKKENGYINGHYKSEPNGVVNGFKDSCRYDSSSSLSTKSDNYSVSGHHQHHHGVSNKFDSFSGQHVGKTDSMALASSYNNSYSKESKNDSSSSALSTINGYSSNHHCSNSSRINGKISSSSSMLCNGSTGGSRHTTPSSSPESQDAIDIRGPSSQQSIGGSSPFSEPDSVDHLKKYTVITTPEQRAQYKADFNAEYEEYRDVYDIINMVSKRFVVFQERLRNCEDSPEESRKIKEQIIKAYQENKQNQEYQEAKKRFNYLHQKLSHIKKLIFQYDSAHMCDS